MKAGASVVVVMGVSGCGKTTLARALAEAWPAVFLDADDFHSDEAKARMANGLPLSDAMRQPWVERIAMELQSFITRGVNVSLAFSGLRRAHRDRLRATGVPIRFVFLQGEKAVIASRMATRSDHYMPVSLLDSQFEALEVPEASEDGVLAVTVESSPAMQLQQVLAWVCTDS